LNKETLVSLKTLAVWVVVKTAEEVREEREEEILDWVEESPEKILSSREVALDLTKEM